MNIYYILNYILLNWFKLLGFDVSNQLLHANILYLSCVCMCVCSMYVCRYNSIRLVEIICYQPAPFNRLNLDK